jgi:hypothetical protein
MIGSPFGPTTPGTCWPRVTVPYPPDGSFLAVLSVLIHPPPKPANNAKVAAVRFIIPPNGRSPQRHVLAIHSRQKPIRPSARRNFGQIRNNRHSHRKPSNESGRSAPRPRPKGVAVPARLLLPKTALRKGFRSLPRCYSSKDEQLLESQGRQRTSARRKVGKTAQPDQPAYWHKSGTCGGIPWFDSLQTRPACCHVRRHQDRVSRPGFQGPFPRMEFTSCALASPC